MISQWYYNNELFIRIRQLWKKNDTFEIIIVKISSEYEHYIINISLKVYFRFFDLLHKIL